MATYYIIILFLTQREGEFRMVVIWFFKLGFEDNHDSILQEVIVLNRIRV